MARLAILLLVLVCVSLQANSRELRSLLSQEGLKCKKSPGLKKHGMELVSSYGPCSNLKPGSNFTYQHILLQDKLEVDSVLAKLGKTPEQPASVTLPTSSAGPLGYSGYYVTVGLGTPTTPVSLALTTGHSLTWTQCQPCAKTCYEQIDPLFNPATSSSYTAVGCDSDACSSSFLQKPSCSSDSKTSCGYNETYFPGSFSAGNFAKETLTLTPTDVLTGFYFGCGQQNVGSFNGIAGFLGLGLGNASLASQGSSVYGNGFSYCLPSIISNSTGHLTLGNDSVTSTNISYTPLITGKDLPFYGVQLQSISVNDKQLPISADVLAVIYSSTAFTFLPNSTYSAVRDAFKEFMDGKGYPSVPPPVVGIEACYDLTGLKDVQLPATKLLFQGGVEMKLHSLGIVVLLPSATKLEACLALRSLSDDTGLIILGSRVQQTYDVVYDIDGGRVGFGAGGC